MAKPHPGHIITWVGRCRGNLIRLQRDLPNMSKEQQLTAIRQQYVVLSTVSRVCEGSAYFHGAPRIKR